MNKDSKAIQDEITAAVPALQDKLDQPIKAQKIGKLPQHRIQFRKGDMVEVKGAIFMVHAFGKSFLTLKPMPGVRKK